MVVKQKTVTNYFVKILLNEALTVEVELDSFSHEIQNELQARAVAWSQLSEGSYAMPNECWDSLTRFNMEIHSMRIIGVEVTQ